MTDDPILLVLQALRLAPFIAPLVIAVYLVVDHRRVTAMRNRAQREWEAARRGRRARWN